MDCGTARETISALIDGEQTGAEHPRLESHLAGCDACRAWRDRAHELTRRARLAAADEVPSPSRELLAAAFDASRAGGRWTSTASTRAGLVAVAVAPVAGWLLLRRLGEPGSPRGEGRLAPLRRLARAVADHDHRGAPGRRRPREELT